MKTNKYLLVLVLAVCCAAGNLYAAITSSYYSSIDGKKESGLRDALSTIAATGQKTGGKDAMYNSLWTAYQTTDVYPSGHANAGKIWDMYGNCAFTYSTNQCGNYSGECSCYNREHSLPKSWFAEATPAYYDLGHIVPTDGYVNSKRSNYAFGEVSNASYTYAGSKLGSAKSITTTNTICGASVTGSSSATVFEPVDEYKGDFARMYMYMVVRYKDLNMAQADGGTIMFNTSDTYYRFTQYSVALLMKWHRQDPVSQKEIDRNNGMQSVQGNRNPFIDYPCLAEYLWGNQAGQTVTLSNLVGTFDSSWTTGDGCPCGTEPAITLPSATEIYVGATTANTSVTKTVTVQGVNLTGNISLALSGTNSSLFSINANTMLKASAEAGSSLTITYTPTSAGNHTATLTISGGGLTSNKTYTLTGTCCTPYNVTLSRNGITETISTCGTFALPTAEDDACDGWSFAGWTTNSSVNTTTALTFTTSVSAATTLYAVYSNTASSSPRRAKMADTWSLVTDATTLKSGDVLVIASNAQGKTAGDISSQVMGSVSSTFSSGDSYASITSLGSGTVELTLGGQKDAWTLTSSSGALGATAAKKLAWASGTTTWSISIASGNATITNGTSSYGKILYNVSSPRFTTYTSDPSSTMLLPQLYRKSSGGGGGGGSTTTYKTDPCSLYTITLNGNGSATGGTFEASASSATAGTVITLDADPSEGYELSGWTVTKAGGGTVTVTNNQFTMPEANVTVTATFSELTKYNIRFYNNGTQIGSTQQVYAGSSPNVPADPTACEGYTFVGWWTSTLAANNTTTQTWVTDFSVTGAQDYYAVYSHTVTSGGGGSAKYTKVTSSSDIKDGQYLIVYETGNVAFNGGLTTLDASSNTIAVTINSNEISVSQATAAAEFTITDKTNGVFSIKSASNLYIGHTGSSNALKTSSNDDYSNAISIDASNNLVVTCNNYNLRYNSTSGQERFRYFGSGQQAIQLYKKSSGGSSTTYYTSSPDCAAPCSNTPSMSFTNTTVNKTTADASFTQTVTISGKGDGQTVAYSSSDETVATVNASGVVTLLGKVGSTTITASVAEDGDYCEASASYTLNVTAAPINVTLYYNNTSATLSNQTNPYTLPTTGAYVADMCDGDWTFDGWYGSTYDKSTTKPTYITELTATGSAYAVYKTTETSGSSAPVRKAKMGTTEVASVTFLTTSTTSDDGTDNSGAIATTLVDQATGISSYSGSKLFKGKSGTGLKMGGSSATGYITLVLSSTVSVKSVNINASQYGTDTGKLKVTIGSTEFDPKDPASDLSFTATNAISTNTIKVETTTKRAYISSITVIAEDGGSDPTPVTTTYYATSPECVTPCSNTPVMSFTNTNVALTTDDASYTQAVTISGKGSGQTVAYSSSDETVATVNASGVVTLLGKVGSTTITASVAEDGDYCEASASYTITVTKAPCVLTGITLNTEDVSLIYTTGDDFSTEELIVIANYSNCADAVVTPTSISTPEMSTAGTKTITVTYIENGVTKTASFDIEVSDPVTYTVTWSVNSTETEVVYNEDDYLVLPSTPVDCSGTGGKKFVGWTAQTSISDGARPSDLFTTASGLVTADATYYAVFATASGSGSGSDSWSLCSDLSSVTQGTYVITWENSYYLPSETTATSNPAVGSGITQSNDALTNTVSSAMQWSFAGNNTDGFTVSHTSGNTTYYLVSTNAAQGISVSTTSTDIKWKASIDDTYGMLLSGSDGGTRNLAVYNSGSWRYYAIGSNYTGKLRLYKKTTGTTTYSDYSLECNELCALTSISLNTDNVAKAFTTGDAFSSTGLVVTANYSNCASATVTPTSISTPDMSMAGTKTVEVSYTENGVTKTADYTITVSAPVSYTITLSGNGSVTGGTITASPVSATAGTAITLTATPATGYRFVSWSVTQGSTPVQVSNNQFTMPAGDVTVSATFEAIPQYTIRFFNNGSQIGSNQSVYEGATPNVPEDPDAPCDGYEFAGWWTAELAADNTESKTWVTDFTVSKAQDYYAVFSKTETTSGGGSTSDSKTFTFKDIASANNWENGTAYTPVTISPVSIAGNGGGNNAKYYTSDYSWRMYSDGSVSITVEGGSVTSVTSTPSQTFTINNGTASLSCSATIKFTEITVGYTISGSGSTTYYTSSPECVTPCTKLETPAVTAVAGNEQITLTWADVEGADHYTVAIGTGAGYTTECGNVATVGEITHSGTTNTCVITNLTNGLAYTTTVVAHASDSSCDSDADEDTTTPQECNPWDDPTVSWSTYSLSTTGTTTATLTVTGTEHGTRTYESSDAGVLTVAADGTVTAQGAGTATVTVLWTAADGYCEKSMVSDLFTVSGQLTVTFNANDGTDEPATKTQTVTYNVETILDANAFTRTGYTFAGWNTQANGQGTAYADEAQVTLTSSITLFAMWQINSHNVSYTINPANKATVQVNGSATTPQSFAYGTSVTVAITPDNAYEITSVTATDVTLEGSGDTRTFTMPDNDVAISITLTAKPTHTVTWSANGSTTTETYYAGQAITFPATAEGCDDKVFVGWCATTVAETDNEPTFVTAATMGDNDITYYAVFATATTTTGGGASSVVDELTLESTGVSSGSTTYSDWSGVTGTSGAVYAGQSAGDKESIQLRSRNSNSGIITTTSGGKATKVTVVWNSNTDDTRIINVYGKNSAYSAASDLYGDNAGTLIGTIATSETELIISDNYEYIGIRSASGALYLDKVSITWTTGSGSTTTYSGYTTSCETMSDPVDVMLTVMHNGNYYAMTDAFVGSTTEIPAQSYFYESETYYYKGNTPPSNITWRIATYEDSYYITNAEGKYLTIDGENISMGDEPFAWSKNGGGQLVTASGTGLCYNADRGTFVVSEPASDTGISPSVTDVPTEGMNWQQASVYTRENLNQGHFVTICLPYNVCQEFLDGVKAVYNVSSKVMSGGKVSSVILMPWSGLLLAGTPYVVEMDKSSDPTITLQAWYGHEETYTDDQLERHTTGLVGNLGVNKIYVPVGCYGLSNNLLRLVTTEGKASISQYKAYFDLKDVVEATTIPIALGCKFMNTADGENVVTVVDEAEGKPAGINWNEPVYNILGIRVGRDASGVLIQNGIKFLVP